MYNKEYSMHSVLEMERDLEKSLQEIMKVKQLGELSQTVLKQANKDTVIKLVNVLTSSLKRSGELLRAAGADVDQLQADQIKLQKDLLAEKEESVQSKDKELKEMKKTVTKEMKSWADVVSKNVKNADITPSVIKEAVKSAVEEDRGEEDRSHNVMVYGLEERDRGNEQNLQLRTLLKELDSCIDLDKVTYARIGAVKEGSVRPVRVTFEKKDFVPWVLSRSRVLKDSDQFPSVFLGPDRSVEERQAHRKLVEEMKKKRLEIPDRVFFIRQGSVCSKPRHTDDQD